MGGSVHGGLVAGWTGPPTGWSVVSPPPCKHSLLSISEGPSQKSEKLRRMVWEPTDLSIDIWIVDGNAGADPQKTSLAIRNHRNIKLECCRDRSLPPLNRYVLNHPLTTADLNLLIQPQKAIMLDVVLDQWPRQQLDPNTTPRAIQQTVQEALVAYVYAGHLLNSPLNLLNRVAGISHDRLEQPEAAISRPAPNFQTDARSHAVM